MSSFLPHCSLVLVLSVLSFLPCTITMNQPCPTGPGVNCDEVCNAMSNSEVSVPRCRPCPDVYCCVCAPDRNRYRTTCGPPVTSTSQPSPSTMPEGSSPPPTMPEGSSPPTTMQGGSLPPMGSPPMGSPPRDSPTPPPRSDSLPWGTGSPPPPPQRNMMFPSSRDSPRGCPSDVPPPPRDDISCRNNPTICDAYCTNFTDISMYTRNGRKEIVKRCIQQAFPDTSAPDIDCANFLPFEAPGNFCLNADHDPACGAICSTFGLLPASCSGRKKELCTVHILQSVPCDEVAEESLVMSIRNFMSSLDVDEITSRFKGVFSSIRGRGGKLNDNTARGMFETFDGVIGGNFMRQRRDRNEAFNVLEGVNTAASQLGQDLMNGSRNLPFFHSGANLVLNVERYRPPRPSRNRFNFPTEEILQNSSLAEDASIQIPYEALCDDTENCSVIVAVSIISNFTEYLQESIDNFTNSTTDPDSVLLSALVFESENFEERLKEFPVELHFTPKSNDEDDIKYTCVFLDETNLIWNSSGLTTETSDFLPNGTVQCTATHLTSFTILVSPTGNFTTSEEEEIALRVVSYVGCGVSILCLFVTIIFLLVLRKKLKKGVLLYIHLNLAIALLLALVVFVGGIQTATSIPTLCTVIAAVIQYLFLCVFCWMLSEGIMLYFLVVKVFSNLAKRWYLLLFLGWGLPLPIVVISAGILRDDYGSEEFCWIRADPSEPAIWTFLVPMMIIIVINSVILVLTVCAIVKGRKHGGAECEVKKLELVKTAVKGSIVLLPLLGVTWVLGLFAVNSNTVVFSWLFTIFNSLQGVFIFILHVARNEVFIKTVLICCGKVKFPSSSFTKSSDSYCPASSRSRALSNPSTDQSTMASTMANLKGDDYTLNNPVFIATSLPDTPTSLNKCGSTSSE